MRNVFTKCVYGILIIGPYGLIAGGLWLYEPWVGLAAVGALLYLETRFGGEVRGGKKP